MTERKYGNLALSIADTYNPNGHLHWTCITSAWKLRVEENIWIEVK
jgi:hypothetical protein